MQRRPFRERLVILAVAITVVVPWTAGSGARAADGAGPRRAAHTEAVPPWSVTWLWQAAARLLGFTADGAVGGRSARAAAPGNQTQPVPQPSADTGPTLDPDG
jgi:hypothetical protein